MKIRTAAVMLFFCCFLSNVYSQEGDAHFEDQVHIGDLNEGFNADLIIWKNHSGGSFGLEPSHIVVGNNAGRLEVATVQANGAFSPISSSGDVVFKKNGDNTNIIFNLSTNGASSDGSRRIIMGDESNPYTFVVTNHGKVGIGTQNFDNRNFSLYVKDGIATEEIMVELCSTNAWCDYVFEDDYPLPPLKYVEQYVQTYKHLPDVPSAQELEEAGGIALKEMTILQQEKIEELFLYIIELDKKVEKLQAENEALKLLIENQNEQND